MNNWVIYSKLNANQLKNSPKQNPLRKSDHEIETIPRSRSNEKICTLNPDIRQNSLPNELRKDILYKIHPKDLLNAHQNNLFTKICEDEDFQRKYFRKNKDRIISTLYQLNGGPADKTYLELLRKGINNRSENGNTALIKAAELGHTDIIKILLIIGAEIEAEDMVGWTALICAAKNGHLKTIEILLEHDVNINHENEFNNTAFMYAAAEGHLQIVDKLLSVGSEINHVNFFQDTALMKSARYGYLDVVRFLVNNGANIKLKNRYRETALIQAEKSGHHNVVKFLRKNGGV